jgi:uncharacterized membrane protein YfcA
MIEGPYILAGALTGFIVGLTGVGGGAIMMPILLLFFSTPPVTAIAMDLWFAAITKMVGASLHHAAGNVDWEVVKRLWRGSLPAALLIVIMMTLGLQISQLAWLTHVIGVMVFIAGVGMFIAPQLIKITRHYGDQPNLFSSVQSPLTTVSGGVIGICVALTSVGAGALGSVALVCLYPLRMTTRRLVATDITHAIPVAVIAGLGYLLAGTVDGHILFNLLLGSIPSVVVGASLANRFSPRRVQVVLSIVLVLTGMKILLE